VRPRQYSDLLAPQVAADPSAVALLSPPLQANVLRGWASALSRLPAPVARHLSRPGLEWERQWAVGERVAAFDWAMVGAGPSTIDLGSDLAANASRLTGPKEQIIARYRSRLEIALCEPMQDSLWKRLTSVAIVSGAACSSGPRPLDSMLRGPALRKNGPGGSIGWPTRRHREFRDTARAAVRVARKDLPASCLGIQRAASGRPSEVVL
jgi:hypothetical protein